MTAGCRSDHTLPVTSIHCGRGVSPVVATTSLDQTCKIYSLADGALQHLQGFRGEGPRSLGQRARCSMSLPAHGTVPSPLATEH